MSSESGVSDMSIADHRVIFGRSVRQIEKIEYKHENL